MLCFLPLWTVLTTSKAGNVTRHRWPLLVPANMYCPSLSQSTAVTTSPDTSPDILTSLGFSQSSSFPSILTDCSLGTANHLPHLLNLRLHIEQLFGTSLDLERTLLSVFSADLVSMDHTLTVPSQLLLATKPPSLFKSTLSTGAE